MPLVLSRAMNEMSDTPLDGTWWLASDGRWYPPQDPSPTGTDLYQERSEAVPPISQLPPPHPLMNPEGTLGSSQDEEVERSSDEETSEDDDDQTDEPGNPDYYGSKGAGSISIKGSMLILDRSSRRNRAAGVKDQGPRHIPLAAITEYRLITPTATRAGWFQVIHGGAIQPPPTRTTWSKLPDTVLFMRSQLANFVRLAARLTQVIESNQQRGVHHSQVDYADRPATAAVAGGIGSHSEHSTPTPVPAVNAALSEIPTTVITPSGLPSGAVFSTNMPNKVERFLQKHPALLPGETIRAVLGGNGSAQVLIATDRRLLVVKVGILTGSTGGGRTTAFNYADVTAIQIQLGITNGSLSVQSPGYGATQTGDFWNSRNQQDPLKLPNVIIWSNRHDKIFAKELSWVRSKVDEARNPAPTPGASDVGDVAQQIVNLAQLHLSGFLTDEEFSAAKSRLLGT